MGKRRRSERSDQSGPRRSRNERQRSAGRERAQRGQGRTKKRKPQRGRPSWVLPVAVSGVVLLLVAIGTVVVATMSGSDGQESSDSLVAETTDYTPDSGAVRLSNNASNTTTPNRNPPANTPLNNYAPSPSAAQTLSEPQVQTQIRPRPPRFWVQLSNLRVRRLTPIGLEVIVDYRVVSGRPEQRGKYSIVYDIPQVGGVFNRIEIAVDDFTKREGTVTRQIRDTGYDGPGGHAYAIQDDHEYGIPVSHELRPGQSPTSEIPPKSPAEIIGAAAVGKAIALANVKTGSGARGTFYSIEYEVLEELQPAKRYSLIIKGTSGPPLKADFTKELRNARIGVLAVTPLGAGPSGSVQFYIATGVAFDPNGGTIVSNIAR